MTTTVDFDITDHGSVVLFHPKSAAAFIWLDEHLPISAQFLGQAAAVEPRFAQSIIDGIEADGLACHVEV